MAGIPVKLSAQRGDTSGTPTIHRFRVDSWDTLKGHIGRIFDPMDDVPAPRFGFVFKYKYPISVIKYLK